jgi:hypothetical protein
LFYLSGVKKVEFALCYKPFAPPGHFYISYEAGSQRGSRFVEIAVYTPLGLREVAYFIDKI